MVTKSRQQQAGKKKKIKVLNLNKETVKDLTVNEAKGVKGGTTTCIRGGGTLSVTGSGIRQETLGCAGRSFISGAQSL